MSVPHPAEREAARGACELVAESPKRVMLPDGSRLVIDPTGVASSRGAVLFIGGAVHVLPPGGRAAAARGRWIGVLRDTLGVISLVPSPLPADTVRDPQAAAAEGGGWHVVFVTGARGAPWNLLAYENADIWYGRFDGRAWSEVQKIASVTTAFLSPGLASNVLPVGGELAFAFPFDRSYVTRSNAAGNQGAVMLRRRGTAWSADTMRTWEAPRSIHLTTADGGRVLAFVAHAYFERGRSHGPALFAVHHATTWGTPRLLYDPTPDYIPELTAPSENSHTLSWRIATRGLQRERLVWGARHGDSIGHVADVADITDPMGKPAAVQTGARETVWLVRDGDSREQLTVYAAVDTALESLGVLRVPLSNFVTHATLIPNGRILALTGGPDTTVGADPPFASYLTELAVRCPVARTQGRHLHPSPRSRTCNDDMQC